MNIIEYILSTNACSQNRMDEDRLLKTLYRGIKHPLPFINANISAVKMKETHRWVIEPTGTQHFIKSKSIFEQGIESVTDRDFIMLCVDISDVTHPNGVDVTSVTLNDLNVPTHLKYALDVILFYGEVDGEFYYKVLKSKYTELGTLNYIEDE